MALQNNLMKSKQFNEVAKQFNEVKTIQQSCKSEFNRIPEIQ